MTNKQHVGLGFILGVCTLLGLFILYNLSIIQFKKEQIKEDISLCLKDNSDIYIYHQEKEENDSSNLDNYDLTKTITERENNINLYIAKLYNKYNCFTLYYIKKKCINSQSKN